MLFSLNKMTEGAINIMESNGEFQIKSPFEGQFMRMADQFQGTLVKDSLQTFQLRSLYTTAGMQFVVPEPMMKGTYGVISIPEKEKTQNDQDALIVDITSNGETVRKKLLGAKGISNFSGEFKVGGLDFNLSYGSKVYTLPFGIKLNDFIAEKHPGTENSYASFMSKVSIEDDRPFDYDIYMNHILDLSLIHI